MVVNLAQMAREAPDNIVVVGRGSQATLYLNTPRLPQMISRLHAELKITRAGKILVKDLGSTNGTFLGDDRIQPAAHAPQSGQAQASAETEVAHGSVLGFGGPARVSRLGVVTENPCRFYVDARPAHVAALAGDMDMLQELLRQNRNLAQELDMNQGCLLHAAVVGGSPAAVGFVLSNFPHMVDQREVHGATPLHFAVKHGLPAVVRALLIAGASPTAITNQGQTVAHIAASHGHVEILQLVLPAAPQLARAASETNGRTALHLAALKGQADAARQLLEFGGDVNARSGDGQTALHMAVSEGQAHIMSVLLAAPGIDPTIPDEVGLTPLHYAAQRGRVEVTRQLLEAGADPRVLGNGVSVSQMAMANGFSQVADIINQWMLSHPAPARNVGDDANQDMDCDSQNGDDDTPMARKRKVEDGDMAGVGPMGATQAAIAAAVKLENQLQSAGSAGERHHLVAAAVEQAGTMQALMHAAVAQNAFYALEALLSVARESQGQGWQPVGPAQGARQAGITQDATRELLSNASDTMFQRTTCAICMEIMVAPYTVTPCGHTFCGTCILQWVKHVAVKNPREQGREGTRISCPKCRAHVTAIPAPALDLGAILEEVVVQMMKEEDKKEWTARHDRWVNEKGVLITAAEDVMNAPSGMQAGLHQGFIRPAAVPGNMVRPEQPALQLSYAGHQIVIDSDF